MTPCPRSRIAFSYLALKVDLLAQVNELLRPLHGLYAGIAFLYQLGVGRGGHYLCPRWGRGGPQMSTALTPELTSFSALKALVAMSSSWEPGVVRFKMFWWEKDIFLNAAITCKVPTNE